MQRVSLCMLVCLSVSPIYAQQYAGIKLNPGERLIAIDGVPVSGGQVVSAQGNSGTGGLALASHAMPVEANNIVGQLVASGQPFSHTPGNSALEKANYERRMQGQGPLRPDPQLQQLALQKATIAAQRRYKNHVGGSLGGASCEGVAHTNGRFLACCLDKPGTYGGAAMVQGADGWYCCLLVR